MEMQFIRVSHTFQGLTSLVQFAHNIPAGINVLLDISHNQLKDLHDLPQNVRFLDCSFNYIESFEGLQPHPGLLSICCSNNGLKNLKGLSQFAPNLNQFVCNNNLIESFEGIPDNVHIVQVDDNRITSFRYLPATVRRLYVRRNFIKDFEWLSNCDNLIRLTCSHNQFTNLQDLPQNLRFIDCSYNQITSLHGLPQNLERFICNHNLIQNLNHVPNGIIYINCKYNLIKSFKGLENCNSLTWIDCGNNRISCFQYLPQNIEKIYYNRNPIFNDYGLWTVSNIHKFNNTVNRWHEGIRMIRKLKVHYYMYDSWMSYWHYRLDDQGFSRFIKSRAPKDYETHFGH